MNFLHFISLAIDYFLVAALSFEIADLYREYNMSRQNKQLTDTLVAASLAALYIAIAAHSAKAIVISLL